LARNRATEWQIGGQNSLANVLQHVRIARIPKDGELTMFATPSIAANNKRKFCPSFWWFEAASSNTLPFAEDFDLAD
jgi:hypothetical protein